MPRRKPKPEKVIQEKIKESLDSIIMEESLGDFSFKDGDLPRLKTTEILDIAGEKNSTLADAKALLDSISEFYVDPNLYGTATHVEMKKKMDSANLSSMMFQLKTAQHAIVKIVEEIDLGNMQPRMFEVLAQLQNQIMQIPKDYQVYLEKMENSYIKAKNDIEIKNAVNGIPMHQNQDSTYSSENEAPQNQSSSIKSRGTKSLMEGLRDILGNEIVDVKPIEVDPNSIVNARQKKSMESDSGVSEESDTDYGDVYKIDDDLI
jgi:hypothetical protein